MTIKLPRPYTSWRTDPHARPEDAAYVFGYHLMRYCRAEAMKCIDEAEPLDAAGYRERAEKAVDTALHNVMDLFEGFFGPHQLGPDLRVEYVLSVQITNDNGKPIERIDLSPSKLDLPVGYWKWKDGEFQ